MKKKFCFTKLEENGCTLLHLAAEYNRRLFFNFLVDDFKFGIITKKVK